MRRDRQVAADSRTEQEDRSDESERDVAVMSERKDQIVQRKERGKEQTSSKVRGRVTRTGQTGRVGCDEWQTDVPDKAE